MHEMLTHWGVKVAPEELPVVFDRIQCKGMIWFKAFVDWAIAQKRDSISGDAWTPTPLDPWSVNVGAAPPLRATQVQTEVIKKVVEVPETSSRR